jgi:hypothetical protein
MPTDDKKAKEFYGRVFDWEFETSPGPIEYTTIDTGKEPKGGMMKKPDEAPMPGLMAYFFVQSVEETLQKVSEAGGKTVVPKTEIGPDAGSFAVFADPDGIPVGIYER